MGTGYTRNDTLNNIADGNVINAADLDGEFDAVVAAFNGSTGHSHDGTTGEGPQITASGLAANSVTATQVAADRRGRSSTERARSRHRQRERDRQSHRQRVRQRAAPHDCP